MSLSTEPGRVMGTVGYMAPEQVRGGWWTRARTSSRSGPSSTRCSPASAPSAGEPGRDAHAILKEDPPSLFESTKNVSPALERIVRRCLEKRPEERFRTAHDLAIALDAISTSSTRSLTTEALQAEEAPARGRRGRLLERAGLLLAGAAIAAGAMLGWARLFPGRRTAPPCSAGPASPAATPRRRSLRTGARSPSPPTATASRGSG